jgi:2-keto-4-pentenoate hydratase
MSDNWRRRSAPPARGDNDVAQAEDLLEEQLRDSRRLGHAVALPAAPPPLDRAYAVQRAVHAAARLPVMVWKLGLTAEPPRQALGATEPVVGRLPASGIFSDRSEIAFVGEEMFAEAELVFELGQDLPPDGAPYTPERVIPAIKGLYAGIEIVRTRFVHSDLPLELLVADNVMAHGLVLGTRLATAWDDRFADLPVALTRNGAERASGSTARVCGDPLAALVWLANWACRNGEGGLCREQLVASGSCTGVTEIHPGDSLVATFAGTDGAHVTLAA